MAKSKRVVPTSIRLTDEAKVMIEIMQKRSGWSVSRILSHCVLCAHACHIGSTIDRNKLVDVWDATHQVLLAQEQANARLSGVRAKLRQAQAAVKGGPK